MVTVRVRPEKGEPCLGSDAIICLCLSDAHSGTEPRKPLPFEVHHLSWHMLTDAHTKSGIVGARKADTNLVTALVARFFQSASIFAASMKSFSDSPPMAWVVRDTVTLL